jgi:hypothetical protein
MTITTTSKTTVTSSTQTTTTSTQGTGARILMWEWGSSKAASYAWQADIKVDASKDLNWAFIQPLKSGQYSGAWFADYGDLTDSTVFALAEFVKNGGKLFFEVNDDDGVALANSFENYFSVSIAREIVIADNQPYFLDSNIMTMLNGLTVGYDLDAIPFDMDLRAFFITSGQTYAVQNITSHSTGLPRTIALYGKLGQGEVIMVIITPEDGFSLLANENIDQYNNKEGELAILRWLGQ